MKKTIILIFSGMLFININAQEFEKNGNYVSAGYGLGTFNPFVDLFLNNNSTTTIGPGMIMYERGITDRLGIGRIGVGANINTTFYGSSSTSTSLFGTTTEQNESRTRIGFMARCAYHFEFDVKKLDFYSGVGFGFYHNSDDFEEITTMSNNTAVSNPPRNNSVSPAFSIFSGARYYLNDTFGFYSELGFSTTSFFSLGVAFRF